ncbi:MAG: DUF2206 domain-containing protein, partial [Halobacteriota archaeon]
MCVALALLLALVLMSSLGALSAPNSPVHGVVQGVAAQNQATSDTTVRNNVSVPSNSMSLWSSLHVGGVVTTQKGPLTSMPVVLCMGNIVVAATQTSAPVNVLAPYVIIAVVTGLVVVLLYLYVRRNDRRGRHVTRLKAASRQRSLSSTSRRVLHKNERTGAQQPHTPEIHIKLNDVSVQNLLAVVLSLQIALWALIGLNVLGISIPIVQPLIGFIYLTFVPGILVLTALRLRDLDIVEIALYAVGLSVAIVLSIGLVANIVFNALNTIKPFSLLAVTSSLSFVVLVLCAVVYSRNRTDPKPLFTTESTVPLAPTLFLCVLPFLAVFSTYLVNNYNVSAGQLFLWLILGVVALLIAFDKFIPSKLYPLAVFVTALTLLFQQTLISEWLIGSDIMTEWSLAQSVLNMGVWNPNLPAQYNGMLSVLVLAPIYSLISSLELVWVFKIAYSVIFALVPASLYQIFRRQLNDKIAFLSCFFFMSFAPFYVQMIYLARQEVAELFFVLLILLLVSTEMKQTIRSALFIIFGLSLVVSHYGLFYIEVSLLFVMWLVFAVARVAVPKLTLPNLGTKIGIHKDKQVVTPSPESLPSLVTIVSISILFIASTAWYFFTAQGEITQQVANLIGHISGSVGELFNPTYSQAATVVQKGPISGILHRVNAYINYLNVFFMLAGLCLTVFLKKQRFKLQSTYVALSTITLGFLLASIAVPYLGAALNWTRTFQITLIVLAPFLAIGFIKIGETAGVTMREVTGKLALSNSALVSRSRWTRLLAIYLVLFMLLSTGLLFALTEDYQSIALSNQVDGVFSHQTIVGATWQAYNGANVTTPLANKSVTIFHYFNGSRYNDTTKRTNSDGQISLTTVPPAPRSAYYATFDGDGYYWPSTSNVVDVNVGSNQSSNQATTSVSSVYIRPATTLYASTTTPAVGQPVTFNATLRSRQVVYADIYNIYILGSLGLGPQAQIPGWPRDVLAGGANIFLGTYNIEHNEALLLNYTGVNAQFDYTNVT